MDAALAQEMTNATHVRYPPGAYGGRCRLQGQSGPRQRQLHQQGPSTGHPGYRHVAPHSLQQRLRGPGLSDRPPSKRQLLGAHSLGRSMKRWIKAALEFLTSRTDGKVLHTIRRGPIERCIARACWFCGDPGAQFDDIINDWNVTPQDGRITSNPAPSTFGCRTRPATWRRSVSWPLMTAAVRLRTPSAMRFGSGRSRSISPTPWPTCPSPSRRQRLPLSRHGPGFWRSGCPADGHGPSLWQRSCPRPGRGRERFDARAGPPYLG